MAAKKKKAAKKLRRPAAPKPAEATARPKVSGKKGRKAVVRSDLPARLVQSSDQHLTALRNIAATDFITDPDSHTVEWHWRRQDRPFQTSVTFANFEKWSVRDRWKPRRIAYWKGIEERVRERMADEMVIRRLDDLQRLERQMESLGKYLEPMLDDKGNPKLGKNGLPVYPLDMPKMDRFIESYLKLHDRVLLLRGEATKRTEMITAGSSDGEDEEESDLARTLRPSGPRMRPKLSRGDARALARQLVKQRAPKLSEVIDATADGSYVNQEVRVRQPPGSGGGGDD